MFVSVLAFAFLVVAPPRARPADTTRTVPLVRLLPAALLRAPVHGQWGLEADIEITNPGPDTVTLQRITLRVHDRAGRLLFERYAAGNGGVRVALADPVVPPGATRLAFNPFDLLPGDLPLDSVDVALRFADRAGRAAEVVVGAAVHPVRQRARLRLPVTTAALVPNGGELTSHHRRLDTTDPYARSLGIRGNFMRYGLDFLAVDAMGRLFRGDGAANADWFGWDAPALAPGDGIVVATFDGQPDNDVIGEENRFDPAVLSHDPMRLYGNYVVIEHDAETYSVLGHLRQGSVAVHVGERVRGGQRLGRIGSSGTSTRPHLHYELRTGPGIVAEGLPVLFDGYVRILGTRRVHVPRGHPYAGDLVAPTR